MLFFVEVIALEQINVRVCLVVILAVDVFERVGTRFALFSFKVREVSLEVSFAVSDEVTIMFHFMGAIVFQAPSSLKMT